MTASYQHLALAEVKPGMILSDVLLDAQGHVLLPQGSTLTEAMLASLPRHGVTMLPVLCADVSEQDEEIELTTRHKRLSVLFRKNERDSDSDWATALLRRYVEDFRLGVEQAP